MSDVPIPVFALAAEVKRDVVDALAEVRNKVDRLGWGPVAVKVNEVLTYIETSEIRLDSTEDGFGKFYIHVIDGKDPDDYGN